MVNIKNYNFNKLDLKLSNSDYWDFYLATDASDSLRCSGVTSGDCFVVWYDFNNSSTYAGSAVSATSIYSLVSWDGAINTGYTLNNIGFTGIDNGLITFDTISGDTSNQVLLSALTGSTLVIPSGNTKLHLTRVTGTTGQFIYPMNYVIDSTLTSGDYMNFCGGFYQGYYKLDGYTYNVLPNRVNDAWVAEFWLNPSNTGCTTTGITGTTLNDVFPNNKGLFFYMGTRSENKFWNTFDGVDSGCTSGCTTPSGCTDTLSQWCTLPRETDISIIHDNGFQIPLNPPVITFETIYNQFLIYGRAASNGVSCTHCGGLHSGFGSQTVCSYSGGGITIAKHSQVVTNTTNPFLIYGRANKSGANCGCNSCSGPNDGYGNETICSFTGFTKDQDTLDYNIDIIDNALGFRIKDDGSIGYRLLTMTAMCLTATTGNTYVSGVSVVEDYSLSGIVSADTWSYVVLRFVTQYQDDCLLQSSRPRVGQLMVYVNGNLKHIFKNFDEFIGRRINDYKDKQNGVPFNISLGGGSQGLLESQTFDGLDMADRGLPIERNFAGSFIGAISQFKFNICDLALCDIRHNYNLDLNRYI